MAEIENLDRIIAELNKYADPDRLEAAMELCCALVEKEAKEKAPKDTGALRRSITSRIEHNENNIEGIVFTPLEYAAYVEYGTGLFAESGGRSTPWSYKDEKGDWYYTSGQVPQPFLRPALAEKQKEILETLKGALLNDKRK